MEGKEYLSVSENYGNEICLNVGDEFKGMERGEEVTLMVKGAIKSNKDGRVEIYVWGAMPCGVEAKEEEGEYKEEKGTPDIKKALMGGASVSHSNSNPM